MESCVEKRKKSGEYLRGILHQGHPDKYKNTVLICLNTGLNDMVGWHRLQVKMARFLAAKGYTVLRYDDTGIGDSDGLIDEESIVKIFTEIETGLFVENADLMTSYVSERFKGHKIFYLGFCGGGLTGIFSAVNNKKIEGVISIGAPVTLSSKEYFFKRDPWVVEKNVQKYRSKLLDAKAWIRFFSFRGDYKTVFTSIFFFLKHKFSGAYEETPANTDSNEVVNLNQEFFIAFKRFLKCNIPALFFYAENDSATWEFKKYFLAKYQAQYFGEHQCFRFVEAPRANHILSSRSSQEMLREEIGNWLKRFS